VSAPRAGVRLTERPPSARKRSFDPVADAATRVLILGSLPGDVSLSHAQYYAHPQNQFWRLIGAMLGVDMPADYDARLAALLAQRVGLWDVVRAARREGSLDADIRDHEPNALADFVTTLPSLRVVAFNGAKAAELGRAAFEPRGALRLINLPSSSAAHTATFEAKAAIWRQLRAHLDG